MFLKERSVLFTTNLLALNNRTDSRRPLSKALESWTDEAWLFHDGTHQSLDRDQWRTIRKELFWNIYKATKVGKPEQYEVNRSRFSGISKLPRKNLLWLGWLKKDTQVFWKGLVLSGVNSNDCGDKIQVFLYIYNRPWV